MSTQTKQEKTISKLDTIGTCLSLACAVHCMLMPFVITLLPLLGLGLLAHTEVEMSLVVVSVSLASISLCWGTRIHKKRRVLFLILAAIFLFWMAGFEAHGLQEGLFFAFGGICLALGHYINSRLCRSCKDCCSD